MGSSAQRPLRRSRELQRETLESERRVFGPDDPETLALDQHLAWTLLSEGHYAEAEKLQRETLDTQRRILGLENSESLLSDEQLGCYSSPARPIRRGREVIPPGIRSSATRPR